MLKNWHIYKKKIIFKEEFNALQFSKFKGLRCFATCLIHQHWHSSTSLDIQHGTSIYYEVRSFLNLIEKVCFLYTILAEIKYGENLRCNAEIMQKSTLLRSIHRPKVWLNNIDLASGYHNHLRLSSGAMYCQVEFLVYQRRDISGR